MFQFSDNMKAAVEQHSEMALVSQKNIGLEHFCEVCCFINWGVTEKNWKIDAIFVQMIQVNMKFNQIEFCVLGKLKKIVLNKIIQVCGIIPNVSTHWIMLKNRRYRLANFKMISRKKGEDEEHVRYTLLLLPDGATFVVFRLYACVPLMPTFSKCTFICTTWIGLFTGIAITGYSIFYYKL